MSNSKNLKDLKDFKALKYKNDKKTNEDIDYDKKDFTGFLALVFHVLH